MGFLACMQSSCMFMHFSTLQGSSNSMSVICFADRERLRPLYTIDYIVVDACRCKSPYFHPSVQIGLEFSEDIPHLTYKSAKGTRIMLL